ncbi:lysoplasmalogenase [uncultured Flavobacterium sp.]|uniref:lysoplasmalogenase n=1 Tax=uncultured Flavobacterium sp. TaxID=165435 RepID=UPI0030ED09E5|tara:strand:- start:28594 stop:29280 length:687 start_codon:yes stop_codon:yes gene_type:complete
MKNTSLLKSYVVISIIYLFIILLGHDDIAWYIKPFLLPFLILAVYFHSDFTSKKYLLTALSFSWLGDIILLFADRDEMYFIMGLIAFLLSHITYILLFNKQIKPKNTKNKAIFWIGATAIMAYLIIMIAVLLPSLGDLTIPVFLYALVISTMLLFAFKGFLIWRTPANWYILVGAIIFVSSDSILAFNKFYEPVVLSSFLIMITYLAAQYLIVSGILKLNKKNNILNF